MDGGGRKGGGKSQCIWVLFISEKWACKEVIFPEYFLLGTKTFYEVTFYFVIFVLRQPVPELLELLYFLKFFLRRHKGYRW